jgi:hypothetical protein
MSNYEHEVTGFIDRFAHTKNRLLLLLLLHFSLPQFPFLLRSCVNRCPVNPISNTGCLSPAGTIH